MSIIPSALIINLIGKQKNICFASDEIREYILDMYLGYKVIENKNISDLIHRTNIPHDIYINQCDLISYNQLINLHYIINNNYNKSIKFTSCSLLIQSNKVEKDNYIQSFIGSPYIYNIYKLDNNIKQKHELLFDIIIANNFKYKT